LNFKINLTKENFNKDQKNEKRFPQKYDNDDFNLFNLDLHVLVNI